MFLFDSHCHINDSHFDADRDATIARMKEAGLVGAMVIGCDRGEETLVKQLADTHPGFLYGAWALHPEYMDDQHPETSVEEISRICSQPEFWAVGETGLDYYWVKDEELLKAQRNRFRLHIAAAKALNKPLIVHARSAEHDAVKILAEEHAGDVGFVLHCFDSTPEVARACVDAGGYVGFTGIITFKSAQALLPSVAAVPLERILVETDCPYMAPVPKRGKRNEPAFVEFVARKVAEVKNIDPEEAAHATACNATRLFRIPLPEKTK